MNAIPRTMQAQPAGALSRYVGNADYFMEKKLDGFRLVTVIEQNGVSEGYSRAMKEQDLEGKLPHLYEQLETFTMAMRSGRTVLDAELTTEDDDFTFVGSVMKSLAPRARLLQSTKRLQLCIFDVMEFDGVNITHFSQENRCKVLDTLFEKLPASAMPDIKLSERQPVNEKIIQQWIDDGAEGCMIKNVAARYIPGKRPQGTWYKVKATQDADVIVMGFQPGQGKFQGMVGAVEFGQILANKIRYRGKASGMTDYVRQDMTDHPEKYVGQVMVIRHMGIGTGEGFRHPQFKGMRDDKKPSEAIWD